MTDYTPTTDEVKSWATWVPHTSAGMHVNPRSAAEFDRWLKRHDAEVAANTTLGIAHRLDTDDPRVGEQLVRFEDEWRKEARGETDGAA